MGKKVFFSFLGFGNYEKVHYYYGEGTGQRIASATEYIQLALVELFCTGWTSEDRFYILMTDDAKERNWKKVTEIGGERFRFTNSNVTIVPVSIPKGFTEAEVMEIFETIYKLIDVEDEISFDITHSFRSMPFIASVIFNYSGLLKSASINRVVYGAFETLGTRQQIERMPIKNRLVPVVDLSSLVFLNELTSAADIFNQTGDVSRLTYLFNEERKKIYSNKMKELGKHFTLREQELTRFNRAVKFVRGQDIDKLDFDKLLEKEGFPEEFPKVYESLFDQFTEKLRRLLETNGIDLKAPKEIKNQLVAILWCIEHDLVQQGLTLLRELIVTRIMVELRFDDIYNESERRKIESRINMAIREKFGNNEGESDVNADLELEEFIKRFDAEINTYNRIQEPRNDMNHGGFRKNPRSPEKLRNDLRELFKAFLESLSDNEKEGPEETD